MEELHFRYSYNPITGEVRYKNWYNGIAKDKVGQLAGTKDSKGYYFIKYRGKRVPITHIIWAMQTGSWPEFEIDHKDRNRANHAWGNLRDVTRLVNVRNKGNSKNSIEIRNGKFILSAWSTEEQKKYRIGTFITKDAALKVREEIDSGLLTISRAREIYLQSKYAGNNL